MPDRQGITIESASLRSMATIGTFGDDAKAVAVLQAEFGIAIPTSPAFVLANGVTIARLAPTRFLASADRDAGLPGRLAAVLAGLAAVTDQSDMWDILLMSGPDVRGVLARLVPIDVHPAVFRIGHLASTRAGHVDVRLSRVAEDRYELFVLRSYAADFLHSFNARD